MLWRNGFLELLTEWERRLIHIQNKTELNRLSLSAGKHAKYVSEEEGSILPLGGLPESWEQKPGATKLKRLKTLSPWASEYI